MTKDIRDHSPSPSGIKAKKKAPMQKQDDVRLLDYSGEHDNVTQNSDQSPIPSGLKARKKPVQKDWKHP